MVKQNRARAGLLLVPRDNFLYKPFVRTYVFLGVLSTELLRVLYTWYRTIVLKWILAYHVLFS